MSDVKHFLDLNQYDEPTLRQMLDLGNAMRPGGDKATERPMDGKVLACIFEKPSTRTRVSFDVGMKQMGGDIVLLTGNESQIGWPEILQAQINHVFVRG